MRSFAVSGNCREHFIHAWLTADIYKLALIFSDTNRVFTDQHNPFIPNAKEEEKTHYALKKEEVEAPYYPYAIGVRFQGLCIHKLNI